MLDALAISAVLAALVVVAEALSRLPRRKRRGAARRRPRRRRGAAFR